MSLTRRQFMAGAGGAAVAAAFALRPSTARTPTDMPSTARPPAPAPATPPAAPPVLTMGRGIDLTPNGVIRPGMPQDYRLVRQQPWFPALREATTHVRLWADWPTLQPLPVPCDTVENPGLANLLALDLQILAANADGLEVVLVPYRYPAWANGTAGIARGSAADARLAPQDRVRAEDWRRGHGLKDLAYRIPPGGHGPGSPWEAFVEHLWTRYVDGAAVHGRVAAFEVVNEPNLQLWPQRSPAPGGDPWSSRGTEPTVHVAVAEMMRTMEAVARRHGLAADLLAPSVSDATTDHPRMVTVLASTPYDRVADPFVPRLLDELDRTGFEGGHHWIWAVHSYNDVERGEERVPIVREQLTGRWRGRAAPDGGPLIYVTEAGVRLSKVGGRRRQAAVLAAALERFRATPGVGLLTHYTVYADPNYDCGLLEPTGAPRPAFSAWIA